MTARSGIWVREFILFKVAKVGIDGPASVLDWVAYLGRSGK